MIKLSVIVATYNSDKTLKKTLKSLLRQTNKKFELIIVDGNSNDETLEIIKSYQTTFLQNKIPYIYISEPDTGIYNAWNKGVKLSSGNWISFLGSDDEYIETAIDDYYNQLIKLDYKKTDLVYSNVNYVQGIKHLKSLNGKWSWKLFRRYMNIAHVGSFHSINYFETYGLFNENYKICGDYELLLRSKANLKTVKVDKTTVIMQSGGISNMQVKKAFIETYIAKCTSGNVNRFIAKYDYYMAFIKFFLKKKFLN